MPHQRGGWRYKVLGQATMEYAVLLSLLAAAILGMQVYAKRGLQALIRNDAELIGTQQQGLEEIDLNLEWRVKGRSKVTEDAETAIRRELLPDGGRFSVGVLREIMDERMGKPLDAQQKILPPHKTQTVTRRTGTISENVFFARDQ